MSLSISVFGLGYVGSVTAACFAHQGHRVIGVDVNPAKSEMLAAGQSPIVEARMEELVAEGCRAGRLSATTDAEAAVRETAVSFVAVGTPSQRNGKLDLSHVEHAAREIGSALRRKKSHHVVVLRSTVLPGSTESLVIPALEESSGGRAGTDFSVCYNPEFMREGSAVADFLEPPYTVLGSQDPAHLGELRELYRNTSAPLFETSITVAEMVKYVSNAFHALKVGFANEMGTVCKRLNADTETVIRIFTSDQRLNISPAYLAPGFSFGGSCLPKDLRALSCRAQELDLKLPLLGAILPSNAEHLERSLEAVFATGRKKVAMLGLSFKAGTDDLRESPQVRLVERLLSAGFEVRVWDPQVTLGQIAGSNRQYIEDVIPQIGLLISPDLESVVRSAEVVIVGTNAAGKERLAQCLGPQHTVIDLVNLDSSRRPVGPARYQGICW